MSPNKHVADERYDYPNFFRRSLSFSLIAATAARGATGMSPHFDGQSLKQTLYRGHGVVAGGVISESTLRWSMGGRGLCWLGTVSDNK